MERTERGEEEQSFVEHQSALWKTGGHTCAGETLTLAIHAHRAAGTNVWESELILFQTHRYLAFKIKAYL